MSTTDHRPQRVWPPVMPTEDEYPAFLNRLIRDLQEPCICGGLAGHTNPECRWGDLPARAHLLAKRSANVRRAAVRAARAERHAVDAVIEG